MVVAIPRSTRGRLETAAALVTHAPRLSRTTKSSRYLGRSTALRPLSFWTPRRRRRSMSWKRLRAKSCSARSPGYACCARRSRREDSPRGNAGLLRNTDPLPSGADAAGYVRLVLRGGQAPTAAELERSFDEFGAFVASLDQRAAVLKVSDEAKALACARAFHAWPSKPHCAAVQAVLRRIRVVAAPVAADGRALPGSHPVMAATRGRLTAVGGV
mmetsp:Transcript_81161/g.225884  ORF Transcript_81161/g.225884 Transcript_81161/m.225884 type:complete len:215 (+) Transcript_81161:438-1082(+)